MASDECEACGGPVGLLGSPCMACEGTAPGGRHPTLRVRSHGATADDIGRGPALGRVRPVPGLHQTD